MIQYISYSDLNEFYSIKEVCRLLEMDKENLRKSCEKYNVKPSRNEIGDWGLTCHDLRRCTIFSTRQKRTWSSERMMTRGHDRTSHRSRDRSPAQDHEATSAKNDLPTVDPGNENRKRMAGKRAVSGGFFAKRDGMIPIRKTAEAGALDAPPLLPYREKSRKG